MKVQSVAERLLQIQNKENLPGVSNKYQQFHRHKNNPSWEKIRKCKKKVCFSTPQLYLVSSARANNFKMRWQNHNLATTAEILILESG